MITLQVNFDRKVLDQYLQRFPEEMEKSIEVFRDRVGFTLEGKAKRAAPVITGNLRRNIIYVDNDIGAHFGTQAGVLESHAKYSKHVHGQPFYTNAMRRKETPFITNAISNSETFIKQEARALLERVVK